ncbi:hypothetical protein [Bacillus sp. KH172YL63]|uniref:hypothetical protein n=1 Tax=Bacillus sp. KH172YL63 TaxID=2709784 RepID=UPI0013E45949|nr:hypothetical protein [Bacillus sp. KH172YL63]BCB05658.1 hypothetical protein KH172YL63_37910 [Bacillus sp. KH172YL63]
MTRLLDARTSQNASFANSINVPLENEPVLIGVVGLNIYEATGPVTAQFSGTLSLEFRDVGVGEDVGVTIRVVRGVDLVADPTVYSATETYTLSNAGDITQAVVTFEGSDYNVVADDLLIYTVYVNNARLTGFMPFRIGPESFNAEVYDNS